MLSGSRPKLAGLVCGLVALHAASVLAPASAALQAVQALAGLAVLFFAPGALFVLSFLRRAQVRLFDLLCLSFAANCVLFIGATTLIKAMGCVLTSAHFVGAVLALTALGAGWLMTRRQVPHIVGDFAGRGWLVGLSGLALVGFLLLTTRPFLPGEDAYWTLDTLPRIENAEFRPANLREDGITERRDDAWQSLGRQRFRLSAGTADLAFENPTNVAAWTDLWLLIEAHGEGEIQLRKGDELLESLYAHPRFQMGQHPRNYPPPNFVVHRIVALPPGRTTVTLAYTTEPSAQPDAFLIVTDLSNLDRASFLTAFRSRYLVDNIGDRQEALELARMLNSRLFLFTHSYDGTFFDRGGYTLVNFPLPFFVHSFALLSMGDRMTSVHLAYLVIFLGIFVATLKLVTPEGEAPRLLILALAVVFALNYGALMRFGIESVLIQYSLLVLFLLLAARFVVRQEELGFLLFGLFACLTKGGVVFMAFMFATLALFFPSQRGATLRLFGKLAGVAALVALAVGLGGYWTGSLGDWVREARSPDYAGRFGLAWRAMQGEGAAFQLLSAATLKHSAVVLVASGFLPLACLMGTDALARFLLTFGLLGHLTVCVSDPSCLIRTTPGVHPLLYFAPAAPLLAAAGLRSLSRASARKWAMALPVLAAAASLVGCTLVLAWHDRLWAQQAPVHRYYEHYSLASVGDYFLRQARAAFEAKDLDRMAHEAAKALKLDYYRGHFNQYVKNQRAEAHLFVGCNHARKRERESAVASLKAAVELDPTLAEAYVSLVAVLLEQGNKAEAVRWAEAGLRAAPDHPKLKSLSERAGRKQDQQTR